MKDEVNCSVLVYKNLNSQSKVIMSIYLLIQQVRSHLMLETQQVYLTIAKILQQAMFHILFLQKTNIHSKLVHVMNTQVFRLMTKKVIS
jgi:hypothetical protein